MRKEKVNQYLVKKVEIADVSMIYSPIACSVNGETLITGGRNVSALRCYDINTATLIKTAFIHQSPVRAVAVIGESQKAISGSKDGEIIVWDIKTASVVGTLGTDGTPSHSDSICSIAVSRNGRHGVACTQYGGMYLINQSYTI